MSPQMVRGPQRSAPQWRARPGARRARVEELVLDSYSALASGAAVRQPAKTAPDRARGAAAFGSRRRSPHVPRPRRSPTRSRRDRARRRRRSASRGPPHLRRSRIREQRCPKRRRSAARDEPARRPPRAGVRPRQRVGAGAVEIGLAERGRRRGPNGRRTRAASASSNDAPRGARQGGPRASSRCSRTTRSRSTPDEPAHRRELRDAARERAVAVAEARQVAVHQLAVEPAHVREQVAHADLRRPDAGDVVEVEQPDTRGAP